MKPPPPMHGAGTQNGPWFLQDGCSTLPNKVEAHSFPESLLMCVRNLNLTVVSKPTLHFPTHLLPWAESGPRPSGSKNQWLQRTHFWVNLERCVLEQCTHLSNVHCQPYNQSDKQELERQLWLRSQLVSRGGHCSHLYAESSELGTRRRFSLRQ